MPPYAIGHTTSTGPEGLTIIRDSGTLLEVGALLLCKSCLSTTEISAAEPSGQKLFQELAQLRYRESLGDTTGVRVGQNLMRSPINELLR